LPLSKIEEVIGKIEINKLNINILGGNIFKYSQIELLIDFLNRTTYNIFYYFHYGDWIAEHSQQILSPINENDIKIILIDFPFDEAQFKLWKTVVEQKNVRIDFLVETDEQIEEAEKLINKFKLNNYIFRPYYNENNHDFFKENVFVSEEDILSVKESLFDLIARKISNPVFFGKLAIDVHENVYSNINLPPVSSLDSLNLERLIYDLITDKDSIWLKSKFKVEPCNKCLYHLLCRQFLIMRLFWDKIICAM
jgi:pseudo-rSAM protein